MRSICKGRAHGLALIAAVITAALGTACSTTPPPSVPPSSPASVPAFIGYTGHTRDTGYAGASPALEQENPDQLTADRVYAALNADPIYFFRHVDVEVDDGVADLSGYVWTTDAIYRARRIARTVPGVTRVVTSHLELEREARGPGGPAR
jgi:BON domain